MIEAGKARSLAVMAAERNPAFKDVPTLKEAMGIDYTTGAWRGFAAPKGLPHGHRRRADRGAEEGQRVRRVPRLHGQPRLRRQMGRRRRASPTSWTRATRRWACHEGRRPRQGLTPEGSAWLARLRAPHSFALASAPSRHRSSMQLSDRVTGLFLIALGGGGLWRLAAAAGAGPAGRTQRFPAGGRRRALPLRRLDRASASAGTSRRKPKPISRPMPTASRRRRAGRAGGAA